MSIKFLFFIVNDDGCGVDFNVESTTFTLGSKEIFTTSY